MTGKLDVREAAARLPAEDASATDDAMRAREADADVADDEAQAEAA